MLNEVIRTIEDELKKADIEVQLKKGEIESMRLVLRQLKERQAQETSNGSSNASQTQPVPVPQLGSDLPVRVTPNEFNGMQIYVACRTYLTRRSANPACEGTGATIAELVVAMQVGQPRMKGGRYKQGVLNGIKNHSDLFDIKNDMVFLKPQQASRKSS